MSLWVVVGGQYGSEGKGKISAFITIQHEIDICIRCGGPNSGHSLLLEDGKELLLRQLPTGVIRPQTRVLVPAGALIDLEVLKSEMVNFRLDESRVGIDRNAMVIELADRENEARLKLRERLSSTLCGVGSAVSRRVLRGADVRLARDAAKENDWLSPLITDVSAEANAAIDSGQKVLVEGTQGFGLSLYHSEHYPRTTSRDTTAAGFLTEVGLSPRQVTEIIVVFRTFPIRVAGAQAGPLKDEITWETIQNESGYPYPIAEMTSVTKKLRRVGRFDWELARRATQVNRPTMLALNGLDLFAFSNTRAESPNHLSEGTRAFIDRLEEHTNTTVQYRGVGRGIHQVIQSQREPKPNKNLYLAVSTQ